MVVEAAYTLGSIIATGAQRGDSLRRLPMSPAAGTGERPVQPPGTSGADQHLWGQKIE
jgi:hypothetical protein